jgi:hypothetical protein
MTDELCLDSRQRLDVSVFSRISRRLWGPSSVLHSGYRGPSPGCNTVRVSIHVHLVLRLRIDGSLTPLHPYAFIICTKTSQNLLEYQEVLNKVDLKEMFCKELKYKELVLCHVHRLGNCSW